MRKALRFVARVVLLLLLLLTGPLLVTVALLVPRVTNPNYLAESFIDSGLSPTVRQSLIDGFGAHMGPEPDRSLEARLQRAPDRHFTQEWFDDQIMALAAETSRWLVAEEEEFPALAVDLTPVRASLRRDPEAIDLILFLSRAAEEEGAPEGLVEPVTLEDLWRRFPDRISLLSEDQEDQLATLRELRYRVQTARRLALAAPLIPLLEVALLLLLAQGPISRLRWLASCLLVVALPILAASLMVPEVVTRVGDRVMAGMPAPLADGAAKFALNLFGGLVPISAGLALGGLIGLFAPSLRRRTVSVRVASVEAEA